MGLTVTSFETTPLEACIKITKEIDRLCFPSEMWLGGEELSALLDAKAEATILKVHNRVIGQAITLPECAAAIVLDGADEHFTVHHAGVYSYSEAIIPEYQHKGYGKLLITEMAIRMRRQGFTSISAHVRTRYGWNTRRSQELQASSMRFIQDFWDDPRDSVVQYQMAHI